MRSFAIQWVVQGVAQPVVGFYADYVEVSGTANQTQLCIQNNRQSLRKLKMY
jgi:hypothetical protein